MALSTGGYQGVDAADQAETGPTASQLGLAPRGTTPPSGSLCQPAVPKVER